MCGRNGEEGKEGEGGRTHSGSGVGGEREAECRVVQCSAVGFLAAAATIAAVLLEAEGRGERRDL